MKAGRKLEESREAALELQRKNAENERSARLEAESKAPSPAKVLYTRLGAESPAERAEDKREGRREGGREGGTSLHSRRERDREDGKSPLSRRDSYSPGRVKSPHSINLIPAAILEPSSSRKSPSSSINFSPDILQQTPSSASWRQLRIGAVGVSMDPLTSRAHFTRHGKLIHNLSPRDLTSQYHQAANSSKGNQENKKQKDAILLATADERGEKTKTRETWQAPLYNDRDDHFMRVVYQITPTLEENSLRLLDSFMDDSTNQGAHFSFFSLHQELEVKHPRGFFVQKIYYPHKAQESHMSLKIDADTKVALLPTAL